MNSDFNAKTQRRRGVMQSGRAFAIQSVFANEMQEKPDRTKQEHQICKVQNRNQHNPRVWPIGPHEHGAEGKQDGDNWHRRMIPVNTLPLVSLGDNSATPVSDCHIKRGEETKPSHHRYQDAHGEKIMKVFPVTASRQLN